MEREDLDLWWCVTAGNKKDEDGFELRDGCLNRAVMSRENTERRSSAGDLDVLGRGTDEARDEGKIDRRVTKSVSGSSPLHEEPTKNPRAHVHHLQTTWC